MDASRYRRLRDVVQRAGDLPADQRSAYLARTCADDAALLAEACRLLDAEPVPTDALLGRGAGDPPPPPRIGPYTVLGEIGRGGMGVVHRGRDERTGADVALKLVHPHLLQRAGAAERFAREARAGLRVRHPNVVATLDVVRSEGAGPAATALVLEYVAGRDLRRLLGDLGTVPDALVREIAAQAAAGLAAIHAAGLVHRDLKPENLVLTDDRRLRIMDLGIAKLVEASADLTAEGQFLGSLPYAAPEQIDGASVDARADLYSLGVVLHELASGKNPFTRGSAAATVRAHAELPPPRLSEASDGVTPFLSAVVRTLLAKRREDRFASADDLARVIAEGEAGPWWASRPADAPAPAAAPAPPARDLPFSGRVAEMARLRAWFADARAGRGRTVLVEAEPGLGRSRLVAEFADAAAQEGADVLVGAESPDAGDGGALGAAIVARFGRDDLVPAFERLLGDHAPMAAAFARLLRGERAADGHEALLGDAPSVALCALLRGLAAERPVVWVLDDLHFASASCRAAVRALARAATSARALVILTSRPGLAAEESDALVRTPGFARLPLAPLDRAAIASLVLARFGSAPLAERLAGTILERTDGVPLHVAGALRALESEGYLLRLPGGGWAVGRPLDDLEPPADARERVRDRLAAIGRDEREILDVAAVQGIEFDATLVAEVTGERLVGVLQALAELERRRGLVRSSGRLHRFEHHLVRDAVLDGLPERLREEYHALSAEALERRAAGGDAHAVAAARHHLHGARPERAAPHLDRAIEQLRSLRQFGAAADLVDRTLRRAPPQDPVRRAELLLVRAALLDADEDRPRQREAAFAAAAEAAAVGDPSLRARATAAVARSFAATHAFEDAASWLRRARDAAELAGDAPLALEASCDLGEVLVRLRRPREAHEALTRCRDDAAARGDARAEGVALSHLGLLAVAEGRTSDALPPLRRACEILSGTEDRRALGTALARLGSACLELRATDEAEVAVRAAIGIAVATGDRRVELVARGTLGLAALGRGEYGAALESYVRQQEIAHDLGAETARGHTLVNVGDLLAQLGRATEARAALDEAAALAADRGIPALELLARRRRALLRADSGDVPGAQADFAAAAARAREIGDTAVLADTLAEWAAADGRAGTDPASVLARLREARDLATGAGAHLVAVTAAVHAAALPGGDAAEAAALVAAHEAEFGFPDLLWVRGALWRATRRDDDLERAHALLERLRAGAPEDVRASAVEGVPLHREIAAAFADRRTRGGRPAP